MDYLTIEVEEEAMATEYASLPQRQSTEEMEPFVELQELVTVRDEEMDFTPVEEEELNSAQRYRGVDRKMENCGSFVLWAPVEPSQEEQLCEGSDSVVSMELSEPVENGETEMSPEESLEHKEDISEAEPVGGSLGGGRPPEESAQEMMEEEEEIAKPKCVVATPGAPKKEHVNVVFMGHVDAGKSTIGGQIILHTSSNSYEDTHHSFQSGKAEWHGPGSMADTSGNTKDPPMNDPAHSSFVPPHSELLESWGAWAEPIWTHSVRSPSRYFS
ncbi:uncharacterized protein LOC118928100 isoform X2 [Manis pentadactyla]|uniref:uncharacterized protein LOC118928100 isoform X2 n=1 Tax=Manis pentadactyla TaxID=143292 RepID=UPI00255C86BE|nr:uncharacterized protein LOC118928100 isoform X2 [Manis pentadactyla]